VFLIRNFYFSLQEITANYSGTIGGIILNFEWQRASFFLVNYNNFFESVLIKIMLLEGPSDIYVLIETTTWQPSTNQATTTE
jgi:hypothetical protein